MDDTRSILWLAIEDYSGLWEAVWQLRTLHPEADVDTLARRAREALTELIERGLVALYRCQEPYGDLSPVDDQQEAQVLANTDAWQEPAPGSVSIRFSATPAGEDAYSSWHG